MSNDRDASDELLLYINNDGTLYRNHTRPLHQRLALAKASGTYDRLRALRGFDRVVDEGARAYRREFPGSSFSVSDKKNAASEMLRYFETEHRLGNIRPDSGIKITKADERAIERKLDATHAKLANRTKSSAQLDREIAAALGKRK
jgi:triphosphoribosyl-dephospho-CoA synthetase